jgi:acyl-CoA-dependent ceramide synthase
VQLSFCLQQILVINIEERRKDHYQMLTHHFITSTLLYSAYVYGFYNVANVVLCIMDIVDFLLPVRATCFRSATQTQHTHEILT